MLLTKCWPFRSGLNMVIEEYNHGINGLAQHFYNSIANTLESL